MVTELLRRQNLPPEDPASVERISVPGRLTDRTVRLFSGQVVPVVEIEQTRGMCGWRLATLLDAAGAFDTVTVEKSPFCRMNSDCWDVKLRFFAPVPLHRRRLRHHAGHPRRHPHVVGSR